MRSSLSWTVIVKIGIYIELIAVVGNFWRLQTTELQNVIIIIIIVLLDQWYDLWGIFYHILADYNIE